LFKPTQRIAQINYLADNEELPGAQNLHFLANAEILASVPVIISCRGVVPQRINAAGVSGGLAVFSQFLRNFPIFFTPMRKNQRSYTASACQSISLFILSGILMAGDKKQQWKSNPDE